MVRQAKKLLKRKQKRACDTKALPCEKAKPKAKAKNDKAKEKEEGKGLEVKGKVKEEKDARPPRRRHRHKRARFLVCNPVLLLIYRLYACIISLPLSLSMSFFVDVLGHFI